MLDAFAAAIGELPDLDEPVDSYMWRETFELDALFGPADTLRDSCADLKDSCINLRTTVPANSSDLAPLIALMGQTHARVSTLEAATAKNEADVATTMAALAATVAAHATTAEAVTGLGTTVTDAVADHVRRHIGSLKSNVSSLGQDVIALRTLLANMHGEPPPPAGRWYCPPHAPPAVDAVPPLQEAQPLAAVDTPPPAAAGMMTPTSKLFPLVDSSNLRVNTAQRERFHTHTVDQRLPIGGCHDNDMAQSDMDRWAPCYSQRAPPPIRPSLANPYRSSRPHIQDSHPHNHKPQMFGDEDNAIMGGSISSPRHIDRRRQAANARVSQFDIAALANAKYHGGGEGYYPLTPAIIHKCGYTATNTVNVISSYNEIILVHKSVMANWLGRFTVGPQINRILKKGLVSLPRLQSLEVESAVEWYDTLQKTHLIYLVPITVPPGNQRLCFRRPHHHSHHLHQQLFFRGQ